MSDTLKQIIEPAILALELECLGYEFQPGKPGLLRVYIDKEGGVTIDEIAKASRQVASALEVADEIKSAYNLEVTSPGSDRPLFSIKDYEKFEGKTINLRLRMPHKGQRKFKGILESVKGNDITISTEQGESFVFAFDLIEKARLCPVYEDNKRGNQKR